MKPGPGLLLLTLIVSPLALAEIAAAGGPRLRITSVTSVRSDGPIAPPASPRAESIAHGAFELEASAPRESEKTQNAPVFHKRALRGAPAAPAPSESGCTSEDGAACRLGRCCP